MKRDLTRMGREWVEERESEVGEEVAGCVEGRGMVQGSQLHRLRASEASGRG